VTHAGLSGSETGGLLLASELFNVLVGPFASYLMDTIHLKSVGKHRFWLALTLPLLCISFVAIWFVPPFEHVWTILYFALVLVIFNFAYGLLLVAYEGCLPLMFTSTVKLSRTNSLRLFVGSIAGVLSVFLAALFSTFDPQFQFLVVSSIVSATILLFYMTFIFFTSEEASPSTEVAQPGSKTHWFKDAVKLFTLRPFAVLVCSHFLLWVYMISIHSALPIYAETLNITSPMSSITPPTFAVLIFQGIVG
jgi:Na+/melibiose symporter-like transporter